MTRKQVNFFLLLAPLILGSCGGPTGDTTFSSIQSNIFTPKCATSGCHKGGSSAAAKLDLSDIDESYEMLLGSEGSGRVGRVSTQQLTVRRVKPGDPDNSYLVQKVRGDSGITGEQMPPTGSGFSYLSEPEIELIKGWILSGAQK